MAAAGLAQRADRDNRLGPWRTRDPYVRNGKVLTPCQKKQCGLCELYFRPDNLPGVATLKSVLAVKARWGVKGVQEKLNKWEVSRLYNTRQLCCFCAQMVAPENVAAATGAAGGSEEGNVESALWPADPREYPPLHCSEWKAESIALSPGARTGTGGGSLR